MSLRLTLARYVALPLLLTAGLLHAQDTKSVQIDKAVARATVGKQTNGAAFLQIENKGTDDALLSASAPVAAKTEIHTMSMEGDVMKMRSLDKLEIKGGEKIAMQPGAGAHIMLMGLKQPLKAGETFPLTLNFRKAGKVTVEVTVKELAMQGKGGNAHDHDSHDHHHD